LKVSEPTLADPPFPWELSSGEHGVEAVIGLMDLQTDVRPDLVGD